MKLERKLKTTCKTSIIIKTDVNNPQILSKQQQQNHREIFYNHINIEIV